MKLMIVGETAEGRGKPDHTETASQAVKEKTGRSRERKSKEGRGLRSGLEVDVIRGDSVRNSTSDPFSLCPVVTFTSGRCCSVWLQIGHRGTPSPLGFLELRAEPEVWFSSSNASCGGGREVHSPRPSEVGPVSHHLPAQQLLLLCGCFWRRQSHHRPDAKCASHLRSHFHISPPVGALPAYQVMCSFCIADTQAQRNPDLPEDSWLLTGGGGWTHIFPVHPVLFQLFPGGCNFLGNRDHLSLSLKQLNNDWISFFEKVTLGQSTTSQMQKETANENEFPSRHPVTSPRGNRRYQLLQRPPKPG